MKWGFIVGRKISKCIYWPFPVVSLLLPETSPLRPFPTFPSTSMLSVPNQLFNMQVSQALPPTLPTARLVVCSDKHSYCRLQTPAKLRPAPPLTDLQDYCQGCILSAKPLFIPSISVWSGNFKNSFSGDQ